MFNIALVYIMQSSMKHCNMMVIYSLPTRENNLTAHKMKANNKKNIIASFAQT